MRYVAGAQDSAPLALEAILRAGSHALPQKAERREDPAEWSEERIHARASALSADKGKGGDFDD